MLGSVLQLGVFSIPPSTFQVSSFNKNLNYNPRLRLHGINYSSSKYFISSVRPFTRYQCEHVGKCFGNFFPFSQPFLDSLRPINPLLNPSHQDLKLRSKSLLPYKSELMDPPRVLFFFVFNCNIITESLWGSAFLLPEFRH